MSQEILERWRAFVTKVTGRLSEVLQESDAGFAGLLADPGLDPITFINAMNAIEIRYKDLQRKLDETYAQQVVLPSLGRVSEAETSMRDAQRWMEERWQQFRTGWTLRLVQTLWQRVQVMLAREVPCSQCGAVLTGRTLFHQAESVRCSHCGAVNSVMPDPLVYTYFTLAPDMVADAQTIVRKVEIERAIAGGASHGERIRLWTEYWTAYAVARSSILPMTADEQRTFVAAKVDPVRRYG